MEGTGFPPNRTEKTSFEAGLAFSDAVNPPEDGTSQQDVDPGVQDLVTSSHADPSDHQPPVGGSVITQSSTVGAQS